MEEDYRKDFKKVTSFFHSNPAPFNRQNNQKQKGPGISDQSLFRLQNSFRKVPLLVMYYLKREKITKFEYLENKKSFFDEIKNVFHSF